MVRTDQAETGEPSTVLLVEDHASFRQALETMLRLEDDLEVVAYLETGGDAGPVAAEYKPDIAIIDLDLPGGDGVAAIEGIREHSSRTACVVLSALTDEVEFGRAIEAGATAVLHKSAEIPELIAVLRRVAQGETVLPAEQTSRYLRALASSREHSWRARVLRESLSARELEVLQRLTEGKDNHAIAQELQIAPDTVQTHVRNLLGKLNAHSRLEAVTTALRLGLVSPPR